MAHQTREPKSVSEFRKDVPPELMAVLNKMMRKEPNERYQTPMELADALAPWFEMDVATPPVHEMPDLCPAVLALTGHAMDRANKTSGVTKSTSSRGSGSGYRYNGPPSSSSGTRSSQASVATARADSNTPAPAIGPLRITQNRPSDVFSTEPDFNALPAMTGEAPTLAASPAPQGIASIPKWMLILGLVVGSVVMLGIGAVLAKTILN
jgi:serine/threonine protein kinase